MKATQFEKYHIELGAKMIAFAGYNMPISYDGIKKEHLRVREDAGMFDVSHMGEFFIKGEEAQKLLDKISVNNSSKLKPGKAQYTCMCYENGGIVDDLIVYQLGSDEYLLVVNAANMEKDLEWIKSQNTFDCTIKDLSDEWSLLAIQGPNAESYLQKVTEINLSEIEYYTFKRGAFGGGENVIISATGYTGERGFEIYCHNKYAEEIWQALQATGIKMCGLAARDTLRLEMAYALYGNDIDENTTPIEAGLRWICKSKTDYIGKEIISEQKKNGVNKTLKGFEMKERGVPRKDYKVFDKAKNEIGIVTSGSMTPSLNKGIGMAYITPTHEDDEILIEIRNNFVLAEIVKTPFYK